LRGNWINKNSGYEQGLCDEIGWIRAPKNADRHYDAVFDSIRIEIKKGRTHVWLDLVRYSEMILDNSELDIVMAFFVCSAGRTSITNIYYVFTGEVIRFMNLSRETAEQIVKIKNILPRSLNAQALMTKKDIERLAFHRVDVQQ